jgi:hypothetical protein
MKLMNRAVVVLALLAFSGAGAPALAQQTEGSPQQIQSTVLSLIRALVDQGVLSAAKAQDMLRQAGLDPALLAGGQVSQTAPATEPAKPVVRVPYLPETVKDELREQLRQEIMAQARAERWAEPGALPGWISRVLWNGDVRVRYQRDALGNDNSAEANVDSGFFLPQGTTRSSTTPRDQFLLRGRFGMDAKLGEYFRAGVRFIGANGDDATVNPSSYNVTQGRYGRPFSAGIDRMFLRWDPVSWLAITTGRMQNPYLASDLVWSAELAFDGLALAFNPRITNQWGAFATLGAHPLQVNQQGVFNQATNQWLYAFQAGAQWKGADESSAQAGVAYYDLNSVEGRVNPQGSTVYSLSAPLFRQRGNTMFDINYFNSASGLLPGVMSRFRLVDAIAQFELARFDPIRLSTQVEWVRNTGFNAREITARLGDAVQGLVPDRVLSNGLARPRVNGYRVAFQVGHHELLRWGDWQAFAGYRYLERDAVLDGLTSADYRLGGTDVKAPFAGAVFAMGNHTTPAMTVSVRYIAGKTIDAAPLFNDDTWFVDFLGRF